MNTEKRMFEKGGGGEKVATERQIITGYIPSSVNGFLRLKWPSKREREREREREGSCNLTMVFLQALMMMG